MLRRPVKQEKPYSYTDIDVESGVDGDPSSPYGSASSSTIGFKLTGLLKKQWQSFTDTNFAICQESTEFVVEHKPVFDKEKLKLIQLSTFIENDITCGTVTAIKTRSQYDGPLLNDQTFSPDWNQDARKINDLIETLNRQVARENLLRGDNSSLSLSSFTSCFSPPPSTSRQGGADRDDMRPMPVEVSQKTVVAFASNPLLFFQSPLHIALLCVLCLAAVGLFSTLSLVFSAISFGAVFTLFAIFVLYRLYSRRDDVMHGLNQARGSDMVRDVSSLVSEWMEKAQDLVEKAKSNSQAGSASTEALPRES
mmetsp:Transcript_8298/g.15641  ORF Transcript_8298/g.15641 Transcript_8298/m.15641 type:complete len:309 (-) Transcript_8298:119-1045(-)